MADEDNASPSSAPRVRTLITDFPISIAAVGLRAPDGQIHSLPVSNLQTDAVIRAMLTTSARAFASANPGIKIVGSPAALCPALAFRGKPKADCTRSAIRLFERQERRCWSETEA
jgi:hypothetical protein